MPPTFEARAMPMTRAFPNEQPVSKVLCETVWIAEASPFKD